MIKVTIVNYMPAGMLLLKAGEKLCAQVNYEAKAQILQVILQEVKKQAQNDVFSQD